MKLATLKFATLSLCWLLMLTWVGCSSESGSGVSGSGDPDTLVRGGYDQDEMAAATKRAIDEVDDFIADLQTGSADMYAVKAPIKDQGETEHFWLTGVTFADGKFTGTIDNDPGIVTNVALGQTWTLGKTEISDWMFMRQGKMHGNYTMRPLLATMPEEEAEQFRSIFASP